MGLHQTGLPDHASSKSNHLDKDNLCYSAPNYVDDLGDHCPLVKSHVGVYLFIVSSALSVVSELGSENEEAEGCTEGVIQQPLELGIWTALRSEEMSCREERARGWE